jgi:hypothetical protein
MAMKKTSGGDSPLSAGCREELLDPPDLGTTRKMIFNDGIYGR